VIDFITLPRRIGIIGSRSFADNPKAEGRVERQVDIFVAALNLDSVVVSGAARGVDTYAAEAAGKYRLEYVEYRPDMSRPSPERYFERNNAIVDDIDLHGGQLFAFVDKNNYRGTRYTLRSAVRQSIVTHVYVFTSDGVYERSQAGEDFV
jgi:hypothetical protein